MHRDATEGAWRSCGSKKEMYLFLKCRFGKKIYPDPFLLFGTYIIIILIFEAIHIFIFEVDHFLTKYLHLCHLTKMIFAVDNKSVTINIVNSFNSKHAW